MRAASLVYAALALAAVAVVPGLGAVVGCSGRGDAGASGARAAWYDTSLDRDLSYLPMGAVAYDATTFAWTADEPVVADAYVPNAGARPAPVVVFLPGAAIVKERYFWLGNLLASHGLATFVVQPHGSFSTSALTTSLLAALRQASRDPASPLAGRVDAARVILAGHSQGASVQSLLSDVSTCPTAFCPPGAAWPDGVRGLLLFGYHNQGNPDDAAPMPAVDVPWLILSGSADGIATPDKVERTYARIVDRPLYRVEVQGMNHYQFTDYVDPSADLLGSDGVPTIANRAARATAGAYAARFATKVLLGDATVPDDLGAAADPRVRLAVARATAQVTDGDAPRVVRDPLGPPGLSGADGNCDVVAAKELNGALYLLTRNETAGSEVWRIADGKLEQVPFPGGVKNGVYGNPQIDSLFGAMEIFGGKLWVAFSSGIQGESRDSTGAELWTYDGATWQPIVSSRVRDGDAVTIAHVDGCDGSSATITVGVDGVAWQPDQWKGAQLDDVAANGGHALVFTVVGNGANTLQLQLEESANPDKNLLDCAKLPVGDATRTLAAGDHLHLRAGADLAGFGDPWNKAISALAVMNGKLYAATSLNYRRGAQVYVTSDGAKFDVAVRRDQLAVAGESTVTSSSILAMTAADLGDGPKLYFSPNGNGGYGARLFALAPDGALATLVDAGRPGLLASGFGRAVAQVASMAVVDHRLWLGGFSGNGLQILSASTFGPSPDLRVDVGDGAATPIGFGDPNAIVAHLDVAGGRLWAGETIGSSSASDLKENSARWYRAAGGRWQLASAHAFGVNQLSTSRVVEGAGGTYAFTGSGALIAHRCIAPARVYRVHDERAE